MKKEIPTWQATRLLQPGNLALVTARHRDKMGVMPVAWLTPLSQTPPLIGVAIHSTRFTHDLIRRSGQFALNLPGRPLAEQVDRLGRISGYEDVDKFRLAGFTEAEPKQVAAPLIEECLAWIECAVVETIETGDHTFFIGEVLVVRVEELAFDETWRLTDEEVKPLHHLGGKRYAVLEEPILVDQAES